jgi:hypothetical protein
LIRARREIAAFDSARQQEQQVDEEAYASALQSAVTDVVGQ